MKKILFIVLFVFLLFWGFNYVSASNHSKVTNIMNTFYLKLDKSISDIEKKINKLEVVNNKIKSIKRVKWNKLSNNSKELINLIESNINNKIRFYKKELENQKEEIDISDLLWDDYLRDDMLHNQDNKEDNNDLLKITGSSYDKTYWDLKTWDTIEMWSFNFQWNSGNYKVALWFTSGAQKIIWKSRVKFSKVYLKSEYWDIIISPTPYALVKTFKGLNTNRNYTLHWVVEEMIEWNELFNITFFEVEWEKYIIVNNKVWKIEFWK